MYGVPAGNIEVIDHEALQDGMKEYWPVHIIQDIVYTYASKCRADMILTFDDKGASLHPNHIATFKGKQVQWAKSQPYHIMYVIYV